MMKQNSRIAATIALPLLLCWSATSAAARPPGAPAPLEERLEHLCERLEEQRRRMNIPGMAIAVVKDDEVILARGFGVRDIEDGLAASENTLFAAGSTTKAFTAAIIAMLIDEGAMAWDDPLRKHLPSLRLHNERASAEATIRDALSHRTGLGRTDLLWASGRAGHDEIFAALAEAEPVAPYGTEFHYNNIMYLAAGEAAVRAAGGETADWHAMMRDRLLNPLGMARSNTRISDAMADDEMALGYDWDEDLETWKRLPMRSIDNVSPAGALNASAAEMAQWVRLMLGRGQYDGRRLISEDQFEQMWKPHIEIAPQRHYGLGWFIREWRGRTLIEHGGNIDGFGAQLALLPEENVGFILLANVSHTPLQEGAIGLVFNALLEEQTPDDPVQPIDYKPYLGKYRFDVLNTEVTVLDRDGWLAVDVPGQMVFTLRPPDEEGRWRFDISEDIAVSFVRGDDHEVTAMTLYQAGLEFELPRDGVERPLEVDADQVRPYLGRYRAEEVGREARVVIHNGRLAVDVPDQMVFELHPPDEDGRWVFRATDAVAVRFNRDEDGNVVSMSSHQNGGEIVMKRIGDDAALDELPPALHELMAKVHAAHGAATLPDLGTIRMSGSVQLVNQGIRGSAMMIAGGTDRYRQELDIGVFGDIRTAFDGHRGWSDSAFHEFEELHGQRLAAARVQQPFALLSDWRETFDQHRVLESTTVDGQHLHRVRLEHAGVSRTVFIDAGSRLISREEMRLPVRGGVSIPQSVIYEDYREISGVQIARRMVIENPFHGRLTLEFDQIEVGVSVDGGAFTLRPVAKED